MKKFRLIVWVILVFSTSISAQLPDTEIYLSRIIVTGKNYSCSPAENITNRPGYDNQPFFTSSSTILYIQADTIQSDVFEYSLSSKSRRRISNTLESEYSPTEFEGEIYVVRVDADSAQRLYRIHDRNFEKAVVIENSDSIGYYCNLSSGLIAAFILGEANTLQLINSTTHSRTLIASDIGRCMKLSTDKKRMFFVLKSNPAEWFIYSLNISDFSLELVTPVLPGSEDFALLPDGSILMGSKGKLYIFNRQSWTEIADFSQSIGDFYRIAINSNGTLLALVGFSGKKP